MTSALEYAQLATRVYWNVRSEANRPFVPEGWVDISSEFGITEEAPPEYASGFFAGVFRRESKIVIAYAGTSPGFDANARNDWLNNIGTAVGFLGSQVRSAALLFMRVAQRYGRENVTFTGHSLGGGLAAVMSVLFARLSYAFAPAPFRQAINEDNLTRLKAYLAAEGFFDDELDALEGASSYLPAFGPLLEAREGLIRSLAINGEILGTLRYGGVTSLGRAEERLDIGDTELDAFDRHSMSLHLAAYASAPFRQASILLPPLLAMMFRRDLYGRDLRDARVDFLERLVRYQLGGPGFEKANRLTQFALDVQQIAQPGLMGVRTMREALIAAAIEYYNTDATARLAEFFRPVWGGVAFDLDTIVDIPRSAQAGYARLREYVLQTYGAQLVDRSLLALDARRQWFVQGGSSGMIAMGLDEVADAMLGGGETDHLDGAGGDDLLVGAAARDILAGGKGDDLLLGGEGDDLYLYWPGDGKDMIIDEDRSGSILIGDERGGTRLAGGVFFRVVGENERWMSADGTLGMVHRGHWTLVLPDGGEILLAEGLAPGDFGIRLKDLPLEAAPVRTILGDRAPEDVDTAQSGLQTGLDELGNLRVTAAPEPGRADRLKDSAGADLIDAGDGEDSIDAVRGGADTIRAGAGRDHVDAGDGDDVVEGGADADILLGGAGADRLYAGSRLELADAMGAGGAGSAERGDFLSGGDGDDVLVGGAARGLLAGGAGEDLLIGGAGDDSLLGDAQWSTVEFDWTHVDSDWPDGTLRLRTFSPVSGERDPQASGADTIHAGAGNDHAWGGRGDDVLYGEAGNDGLSGEWGDDILFGGEGADVLFGDGGAILGSVEAGEDFLDGGAGADRLYGGAKADILFGGDGGDWLHGDDPDDPEADQGADYLDGGAGDDVLLGFGGDDTLRGGEGRDELYGGHGDDALDGGADDDRLYGEAGADHLAGGAGVDLLDGGEGDDFLDGGPGDDVLDGGAGDDVLLGGGGADTLLGGPGDDVFVLSLAEGGTIRDGEGTNTLRLDGDASAASLTVAQAADDPDMLVIAGGAGPGVRVEGGFLGAIARFEIAGETLSTLALLRTAQLAPLRLAGREGADTLIGSAFADTLEGRGGDDLLEGNGGDDVLSGGPGNDRVWGGEGADFLDGGPGNDVVEGGAGSDTYRFGFGIGRDEWVDTGESTVVLDAGLTFDDLEASVVGGDVFLALRGGGEGAILAGAAASGAVWTIRDALGGSMTLARVLEATQERLRDWRAKLIGDFVVDATRRLAAELAESGFVAIASDHWRRDAFPVYFGASRERVQVTRQVWTYLDGRSSETSSVNVARTWEGSTPYDFAHHDTMRLVTERIATDDALTILPGGLELRIDAQSFGSEWIRLEWTRAGRPQTIRYGFGQTVPGSGWLATLSESVTVFDTYSPYRGVVAAVVASPSDVNTPEGTPPAYALQPWWRTEATRVFREVLAGPGDNTILGGTVVDGGAGKDTLTQPLHSPGGLLLGGPGDDRLEYGAVMAGEDGDDRLLGGAGATRFVIGALDAGTDSLSDHEVASKEALADAFYRSLGIADWQERLFVPGWDADLSLDDAIAYGFLPALPRADDYARLAPLFGAPGLPEDTLEFGPGLAAADIRGEWDALGAWLVISALGRERARLWTPYSPEAWGFGIERVLFADGSSIGIGELIAAAGARFYRGTDSDDLVLGTGFDETFGASPGDDSLYGYTGNDVFLFARGAGRDMAFHERRPGETAIARFVDIGSDEIVVTRDSDHLYFVLAGSGDRLGVANAAADPEAYGIDRYEFADGTVWTQGEAASRVALAPATQWGDVLWGTQADDAIAALAGDDALYGNGGDDRLDAGEGDDSLAGGAGDDVLRGGAGDDFYEFTGAIGRDLVEDEAGEDWLHLDRNPEEVRLSRTGDRILLALAATGESIAIRWGFGYRIEHVQFADGTEWDAGTLEALAGPAGRALSGTRAADTLLGTDGPDELSGLGSADLLVGLDGDDLLDGGAGADRMEGGPGDDTYLVNHSGDLVVEFPGEGNDTVRASVSYTLPEEVENLVITGTRGRTGTGNAHDNTITGGDGNDTLDGAEGDDTLAGGAGADTLRGGPGDDTFLVRGDEGPDLFSGGEGFDTVLGSAGDDVIRVRAFSGANTVERIDGGAGLNLVAGTAANNVIDLSGTELAGIARVDGGEGDDRVTGSAGDDTLAGGAGNDVLRGGPGADLLQGGAGDDRLVDETGANLLDGGEGADTLIGGEAAEFLAGGRGNDVLKPGSGADVVAFNAGDGADLLYPGSGAGKTLSLGGGIAPADLAFGREGKDLVLEAGGEDRITLKNWYGAAANRTVSVLQLVAAAMPGYDPASADALAAAKVQRFDFKALVAAFDAARQADANLVRWRAMDALLDAHLAASDDAAVGGDLAFRYGLEGSLAAIGTGAARDILRSPDFGAAAQGLLDANALAAGPVRLASP